MREMFGARLGRIAGVAVAAVLVVWGSSTARAAMLRHYDLTSLALMSDAVVRAHRTRTQGDLGSRTSTYVVDRWFAGPLRARARIEVDEAGYVLDSMGIADRPPPAPLGRDALLFLTRREDGRWVVTSSGLRVTFGAGVYRFEQLRNPGPYVPVPQGRDPDEMQTSRGGASAVSMPELERMVAAAVTRANEARRALALAPGATRRAALLALLPPPRDPEDDLMHATEALGFYTDHVVERVVHTLAEEGDTEGALDALGRVIGMTPWPVRGLGATTDRLLTLALDPAQPVARRARALAIVWDPDAPREATIQRIAPLLADRERLVRAAAVGALERTAGYSFGEPGGDDRAARNRAAAIAAIRRAWSGETDPLVRAAHRGGERLRARGVAAACATERCGRRSRPGSLHTRARDAARRDGELARRGWTGARDPGARDRVRRDAVGGWARDRRRAAMTMASSYVEASSARDPLDWTPEWSRRARGVAIYAVLRDLGRRGVESLIDRSCAHRERLVDGIGALDGAEVVAKTHLNQGLVRFPARDGDHDRRTDEVIAKINATGEAFFSGTTWNGARAIRVSVVNWRTTSADVERALAAVGSVLARP